MSDRDDRTEAGYLNGFLDDEDTALSAEEWLAARRCIPAGAIMRTAKKRYLCEICGDPISPGERYFDENIPAFGHTRFCLRHDHNSDL